MESGQARLHTCQLLGTCPQTAVAARTHPPPTSNMGEAPLLGNVQPRSSARNFAIYEKYRRVPPEALGPSLPRVEARAVRSCPHLAGQRERGWGSAPQRPGAEGGGASAPAAGPLQLRGACEVRAARSPDRAARAVGAAAPLSALAFHAECHYYHSKGRAPPRGWWEGQQCRRAGGRAGARAAGGQSSAAQEPASPTLGTHTPATLLGRSRGFMLSRKAGSEGGGGSVSAGRRG